MQVNLPEVIRYDPVAVAMVMQMVTVHVMTIMMISGMMVEVP
jgi:hypothetical protein